MTRFLAFDYLLALWIYEWLIWMLLWFFRVNFCILRLTSPWPVKRITIWTYALCCRQLDNEELPDINRVILLDDGGYGKKYWLRGNSARSVHHRFWLASSERPHKPNTKFKRKFSLDMDCFETRRNTDDVFEKNTFQILTERKTNLVLFFTISISQLFQKKRNTMNQFY